MTPRRGRMPAAVRYRLVRAILPENVLLLELIERFHPERIVSIHGTWAPGAAGVFYDRRTLQPAEIHSAREWPVGNAYMRLTPDQRESPGGQERLHELEERLFQERLAELVGRDRELSAAAATQIDSATTAIPGREARSMGRGKGKIRLLPPRICAAAGPIRQWPAMSGSRARLTIFPGAAATQEGSPSAATHHAEEYRSSLSSRLSTARAQTTRQNWTGSRRRTAESNGRVMPTQRFPYHFLQTSPAPIVRGDKPIPKRVFFKVFVFEGIEVFSRGRTWPGRGQLRFRSRLRIVHRRSTAGDRQCFSRKPLRHPRCAGWFAERHAGELSFGACPCRRIIPAGKGCAL